MGLRRARASRAKRIKRIKMMSKLPNLGPGRGDRDDAERRHGNDVAEQPGHRRHGVGLDANGGPGRRKMAHR